MGGPIASEQTQRYRRTQIKFANNKNFDYCEHEKVGVASVFSRLRIGISRLFFVKKKKN